MTRHVQAGGLIMAVALLGLAPGYGADITIAAHYYSWYGGKENPHWSDGVAHRPWIGYYSSASPSVVRQQIDVAVQYGVDVFAVGWTGINSPSEKKFRAGVLGASNLNRIRFCMVYDTASRLRGEATQPLAFDFNQPDIRQKFVSDMVYLAKQYFGHSSYFRIDGRPVLKVYLARSLYGDFAQAVAEAREKLKALGYDVYLVGDSLFYGRNDFYAVSQFDAATSYNIFSAALFQERIDTTLKLARSARPLFWNTLYSLRDVRVSGRGVPVDFQPGVVPQFDTRGAQETSVALLAQSKNEVKTMFRVAKEIVDAKTSGEKIVWVTSWNEWHEGTAIEPTETGGQKYPGGNFSFDFVEALAEVFR